MNRASTHSLAALAMTAAAAVSYWQLAPHDQANSAPISRVAPPRPVVQKLPADSIYTKITDPSVRWEVRVDMLRRIQASKLTSEDIDTLYGLLTYQPAPGQQESWWVVVNEIMEQLRLQAIAPERYSKEMLAILRDSSAPEVLRDYAVQHLGQWVSPRAAKIGQPHEQNPEVIRETAQTLADLVTDPSAGHGSVSGTALMLLIDMKGGVVDEAIMSPVLDSLNPWFEATLAGTNRSSKITRISAINAIGMLQLDAFRPQIRELASSDTTDPSLRLNSIAALGQIGEESDLKTLETIAANDRRLHYAAQAALEKLSAKPQ